MKCCNGCGAHCELGYTISDMANHIAPRVGDVTYWVYDIYASGVKRVLFRKFVGTDVEKARLKRLAIQQAKDIARYCSGRSCQK